MDSRKAAGIQFVVGEEKKLLDIIARDDICRLLQEAVKAGADRAYLHDPFGMEICSVGKDLPSTTDSQTLSLFLEGEVVALVTVSGSSNDRSLHKVLANIVTDVLQMLLTQNLKRMLTTEIHTTVVSQSYDELLETNRKLTISEAKFRDLAANLEKQVALRTEELKRVYARLLQQEKIAAVGQLAAGVAHEINNPLGFVLSNLSAFERYRQKLTDLLLYYKKNVEEYVVEEAVRREFREKWQKGKIDFILEDLVELLEQSVEGCNRVKNIVADLKGFSHIDHTEESGVDLNGEIDQILRVIKHQIPEDVVIEKKYGNLPEFRCNPGLLCQVFLNIILNALEMQPVGLHLIIETTVDREVILVRIQDNGPGIPADILNRIFEPFFTTKDVGKGMGMGLTNALEIINSLGGTIEVDNGPGGGALFAIRLPLIQFRNG